MAGSESAGGMVPEQADLVTQDMGQVAALIRGLYLGHAALFRRLQRERVQGVLRPDPAGGLRPSLLGYGGFAYRAETEPENSPSPCVPWGGSKARAAAPDDAPVIRGDVFMMPLDLRILGAVNDGEYTVLAVPWEAACSVAEEHTGLPAGDLRFESMAPVSAARQRMFAQTTGFAFGQLVSSEATEASALVLSGMTRLTAASFLATFPNTAMTAGYVRGPGWMPPANVRRAVGFIDAYADQPITVDQIAAAAFVTGRALQYAFRRHYGTTPIGYLRWVRLERAHVQLQAAEPGDGITVAAVARRWGWASPAHFAAAYRQRFGVPPSYTLRR